MAGLCITVGIGGMSTIILNVNKYGGSYVYSFAVTTFFIGVPLFFFEVALGQFTAKGPIQVFTLVPLAEGIGYTIITYLFFEMVRYNVWIAVEFFFLVVSFNIKWDPFVWTLPWDNCTSTFNCISSRQQVEDYLFRTVLDDEPDLSDGPGSLRWWLVGCLAIASVFIYWGVRMDMKLISRVMVICMPTCIIILFVMLFTLMSIPGTMQGLSFLFSPTVSGLLDYEMWIAALDHSLYGYGLGTLIMLGSYSRFQSPSHIDSLIICVIWYFTIMLYGVVIFGGLGAVAVKYDVGIKEVMRKGYHKSIIASEQVLSLFPFPPIWSVYYFLMIFCIGLSTLIFMMWVFKHAVLTFHPPFLKHPDLVSLVIVVLLFLLGLVFVTQGGSSLATMMSTPAFTSPPKFIISLELVTFIFGYGLQRLHDDLQFMLHYNPSPYYRYTWVVSLLILVPVSIYQIAVMKFSAMPAWVLALSFTVVTIILLLYPRHW